MSKRDFDRLDTEYHDAFSELFPGMERVRSPHARLFAQMRAIAAEAGDYDVDVSDFVWGRVVRTHSIGRYTILEYYPYKGSTKRNGVDESVTFFHPYVDGEDTRTYTSTLEGALIAAICHAFDGSMDAAVYIYRMIGLTKAEETE